ncbi:MAG: TrkA family potassium uptake protein [Candidatus Tectimicrobiota bacterium]
MARQVLIVGGGEVGTYLASLLLASGHQVRVLEKRPEELPRLQQALGLDSVLIGDGTDPGMLESAGIRQAQVVAAVTGTDETNLVVTGLARFAFQVSKTIARVHTPSHAWMFTPAMGVDVALNQADILGHLIAEEMSLGDMMTLLKLRRGQYALVEEQIHPSAVAAGKAIRTLALPSTCALTAILRQGQLLLPRAELVLQAGDEVLAIVHVSQEHQLEALLSQAA